MSGCNNKAPLGERHAKNGIRYHFQTALWKGIYLLTSEDILDEVVAEMKASSYSEHHLDESSDVASVNNYLFTLSTWKVTPWRMDLCSQNR
jgi:hypothetical protein